MNTSLRVLKMRGDAVVLTAREVAMGWREDDEKAYTTYDDIVGRSIRRGTRKAFKALTFGLAGDSDPFTELAKDAARELPTAIERSRRNRSDDD